MKTLNIPEEFNSYFTANKKPEVVDIDKATYVYVLGKGRPGTTVFYEKKAAIKELILALEKRSALASHAFTNRIVKIFYWFDEEKVGFVDIGRFYTTVDLDLLHYRIAIRIPDFVTGEDIQQIAQLRPDIPFANEFEHFTYTAGTCVQILHLGPFAGELQTLPVLQRFATENGFKKSGMHHEIHLTNFEPGESQAHLQTILRDPVIKQG